MSNTLIEAQGTDAQTGGEPCLMGENTGGTRFIPADEAATATGTHGSHLQRSPTHLKTIIGGEPMHDTGNTHRLRWLASCFGLPPRDIARISGFSRSYVARIMAGDDGLGSDAFWTSLEKSLPLLLEHRTKALFLTRAVGLDQLKNFGNQLKKCA